jgi:transposase
MSRVKYDEQFKASAVNLVLKQGYSIPKAASSLGVNSETLRYWVKMHRREQGLADAGQDAREGTDGQSRAQLRAEIAQLKRENARLTMEREILKKATAFFAKEGS